MIETELVMKPWYRLLSPKQKCLWIWIVSRCDMAGVLDIDWGLTSFAIGEEVSIDDIAGMNGNVIKLTDTKIFVPDFIGFQNKHIQADNKVHFGIRRCLNYHAELFPEVASVRDVLLKGFDRAIDGPCKGLCKASVGVQGKGKGKGQVKGKDSSEPASSEEDVEDKGYFE